MSSTHGAERDLTQRRTREAVLTVVSAELFALIRVSWKADRCGALLLLLGAVASAMLPRRDHHRLALGRA